MTTNPHESMTPSRDGDQPVEPGRPGADIPPQPQSPGWEHLGGWPQPPTPPPNWQPIAAPQDRSPCAPQMPAPYAQPPSFVPYAPPPPPKRRWPVVLIVGVVAVLAAAGIVTALTLGGGSNTPTAAEQWHAWLEHGGSAALSRYTSDHATRDNAEYCATGKTVAESLVDDTQAVLEVSSPLPDSISGPLRSWANHARGAAQADIAYCSVSSGSSAQLEAEATYRSENSAADAALSELRGTLQAAGVAEADLNALPSGSGSGGTA